MSHKELLTQTIESDERTLAFLMHRDALLQEEMHEAKPDINRYADLAMMRTDLSVRIDQLENSRQNLISRL